MMAIDITPIINVLILLVATVIGVILNHMKDVSKSEEKSNEIDRWVNIAVSAAEQAYKTGMTQDRKKYALEVLKSKNLSMNIDEVDKMIEAAVAHLPKTNTKITSELMLDGKGEGK